MSHFSVISSILSPADLAAFVHETYSLNAATACRLLKAGINHTYRIDSGNEVFIFRIYSYNWRTREEIKEELSFLQILQQYRISVSYPIADSSGNFIQTIQAPEGQRFVVLFSYAPGHKIQNYSKEAHFEIGQLMARIHGLAKDLKLDRVDYTPDVLLRQSLDSIRQFLPDDTNEMQFLIATLPLLENELLNADNSILRKGVVHLDIWFDNLNISGQNKITLFDFDFCGNGWLCMDIAYYILQLHNTEKDENERASKMQAFYDGYEAIQTIHAEEKKLIPILGVCLFYFYLGVQCRRFDNWSNSFLNENYLKRFITVLIKGYYDAIKHEKMNH